MKYSINKKSKRIVSAFLMLVFIISCSFNAINAQAAEVNTAIVNNGPGDEEELEKFCNDFFNKYIEKNQVSGAVISVVKNGKILFEKGYGYADIENKIQVDPKNTAFYICSIGKLFTGTAVMQLYEQGKIKSLTDDVNLYLDTIKVPNKFSTPVTFANLLTHTSGLDDGSVIGGASKTKEEALSYEAYLKAKIGSGSVLREPDTLVRYSNLGYDLLGYLVQEISGVSFANYVRHNIFGPIGMKNSMAGVSPDNTAKAYIYDGEEMKPSEKVYLPALGEGCVFSTADDMAKFMIAHLQGGSCKGSSILKEDTARLMHTQHFTNNSELPGICYTFLQSYDNNQKAIRHEGGDASGFVSTLYLLPEYKLGFFVEVNTLSALPITFEKAFLNHYFPYNADTEQTPVEFGQDYGEIIGTYRSYDDISVSTILKIMALFSDDGEILISKDKDGMLKLHGTSFEGYPIATKLIQTGDLHFKRADDASKIVFRRDKHGNVAYAFNNEPQKTFEKIKWYQTQKFNFILLGYCILVLLINVIWRSITYIRRKKKEQTLQTRYEAAADITMWAIALIDIASTAAFALMLFTTGYEIQFGFPLIGYLSLGGFLLGTALSIGAAALCMLLWIKKRKSLIARIIYTISTISCMAFIWFLNYWNVLGFKLN